MKIGTISPASAALFLAGIAGTTTAIAFAAGAKSVGNVALSITTGSAVLLFVLAIRAMKRSLFATDKPGEPHGS